MLWTCIQDRALEFVVIFTFYRHQVAVGTEIGFVCWYIAAYDACVVEVAFHMYSTN